MDLDLVDLLIRKNILLTPSRRLASRLRQECNLYCAKESTVWETPRIYAIEDWFLQCWDKFEIEGKIDKQLLDQTQALLKWEDIIAQSEVGKTLLRIHTTAKTALSAWNILHQWQAENALQTEMQHIDHEQFRQWALSYASWLDKYGYVDPIQISNTLLNILVKHPLENKNIILYGFEELVPNIRFFFDTLKQNKWRIDFIEPDPIQPEKLMRFEFLQCEQEFTAAACWAKEKLLQGKNNIAIVVPNLADYREDIDIIFNDVLAPGSVCQPVDQVNTLYNISAAVPLVQYPLIQGAFAFLKMGLSNIAIEDITDIFTSPFLAHHQKERYQRANAITVLKKINRKSFSIAALRNMTNEGLQEWHNILVKLGAFFEQEQSQHRTLSFSKWADHFKQILHILGWPGERSLTSIEHQVIKRWAALLDEVGCCDSVLSPGNYFDALSLLRKLASDIPFQAENRGAPIQILGLLEGVGQHFDSLWVMGLNSEAWPPVAKANPFLPIDIQRKLKMPHASPEREMEYAALVTKRFKESANEIVFSYATQNKEKTLAPSELIKAIPLMQCDIQRGILRCEDYFQHHAELDNFVDEKAPPLLERENFKATTQTILLQTLCPFKAFAQIRLNAKCEETAQVWLQPYQQGTILHNILQDFWRTVKNQNSLLALSQQTLNEKVTTLIDHHIQKYITEDTPLPYLIVEKNRLRILLNDFFELEKQRASFTVIATEKNYSFTLAGLNFNIRIDRIDQDEKENTCLIDYKSGKFKISDLIGEPIKAPQLALYYIASQDVKPTAIFVAKIGSDKCTYEGISQDEIQIPGVKSFEGQWDGLNAYWTSVLSNIVESFIAGNANVHPIEGPKTCQYCHLSSFCRIYEREAP